MRKFLTAITGVALALSLVAQASPAAAVAGYDSRFVGESPFVNVAPGETATFTAFFQNMGTTAWVKGTASQVDLFACLDDKVTCDVAPEESAWNPGTWLSATRYTTHTEATVAQNGVGTFTYQVRAPATATAGTYRFNGDLGVSSMAGSAARVHPEGYYQEATILAGAGASGITITPASDTNQTGQTHTVTITYRNAAGQTVANTPIDVFVVSNTTPFTSTGQCSLNTSASPNSTGTACTIDSGDFVTGSNGTISFSYTNTSAETDRIVAWTGDVGATFDNDTVTQQGSATKTWINAVAAADSTPGSDVNPFASPHTVTVTLEDSGGTAVPLADQTVRITVYRGTSAFTGGTTNTCTSGTVVTSTVASTDAGGAVSFTYTGPADPSSASGNSLFDCIFSFYDADNDGILDAGEFGESVIKTWTDATATATTLTQSPTSDANPASTTHVVTATLRDQFGNPISGATLRFSVSRTGATATSGTTTPITQTQGTRTTDASGTAQLGYVGPADSATDTISVCYDVDTSTTPCDGTGTITASTATKYWGTAATAGTYTAYAVRFCDTANDTVYAQSGTTTMFRFIYDAGDQFTVDGSPTTMAGFETACDAPTDTNDTITITYNPDGVSSFVYTNVP